MEFRVLQYFLAVAREETISGAAEALHITQPTLSRQLKELEEELGKTLFIRGNRQITLTEDGMLLRKRAEEITSLVERTEIELMSNETSLSGNIYIGSGETELMRLIIKSMKQFQERYPMIKFHMYSGNAEDISDRLEKGLLDFGIIVGTANMSHYDFIKIPLANKWGLLMRKDSPLAALDKITSQDLIGKPIICSHQDMVNNEISGWLGVEFEKLNIVATYNLIFNASLMVEENMGYALCLDGLVNTDCNSILCFKPLAPDLEVHLTMVWKKYQIFSRASEAFLKAVRADLYAINENKR